MFIWESRFHDSICAVFKWFPRCANYNAVFETYTTYYLQCDGFDVGPLGLIGVNEQGVFNISVTDNGGGFARPANDDLVNAAPVQSGNLAAGGTLTVNGYNKCATCENNEPGGMDYCGTNTTAHTALLNAEDETV